jgi:twitching motility two-component system response regulator PilG
MKGAISARATPRPTGAGEAELAAALEEARGGNRERAQDLAWQSLKRNPRREAAWLFLASLVPSREDQEMCLRQVLALNPEHAFAREWFAKVMTAEHLGALALPFVDETAVLPPPAAEPAAVPPAEEPQEKPMAKVLALDTVPIQRLPAADAAAEEPPQPAAPRPRVLVVDDSATVRRLVSLALDRLGCEVVTASSGLEALSAMSHAAPDLVLLDVGLPNLDGHQICRAIKRNDRTRDVPVIMLTGRDGLMDRLRGKMAGAAEYLTKPFDPKALTAVVGRYITFAGQAVP